MSKKGTMVIMKEHEHEGPMNEELKALEAHMLSVSKQGQYKYILEDQN